MKSRIASAQQLVCCAALMLLTIALAGCGSPSALPPSEAQKSEVAQKSIDDFIASATKNPKGAAQELSILMESLEAYATEYQGAYTELRDAAKELQSLYQSGAPKDKIQAQLEVLKQKAAALSAGS
tara:strand:- start:1213 stop:1590 length:378 start_codon:yes stop_codon:yes gene_type:complete